MELKELVTGDKVVARYGSEFREMDVLANDTDRQQITLNVRVKIGVLDEWTSLQVMEYSSYNLEKWGKLNTTDK